MQAKRVWITVIAVFVTFFGFLAILHATSSLTY